MTKEILEYVKKQTAALISAQSCSKEVRAAAEKWLKSIDTDSEKEATKAYLTELELDIMPVDGLIALVGSDVGKKVFGTETAKKILLYAEDIKAAGAVYCDCPACAAAKAILDKKQEIL